MTNKIIYKVLSIVVEETIEITRDNKHQGHASSTAAEIAVIPTGNEINLFS